MTSTTFFFFFIPLLAFILLAVNLIFAPHNPYQEKDSAFECGFHSFLGQNRTQFSISFFIFALLFLLFDLEILLVYPYIVSAYANDTYGLVIMLIFFSLLATGFVYELGKNALKIDSKQMFSLPNSQAQTTTTALSGYNLFNFIFTPKYIIIIYPSLTDYLKFDLYNLFSFSNKINTLTPYNAKAIICESWYNITAKVIVVTGDFILPYNPFNNFIYIIHSLHILPHYLVLIFLPIIVYMIEGFFNTFISFSFIKFIKANTKSIKSKLNNFKNLFNNYSKKDYVSFSNNLDNSKSDYLDSIVRHATTNMQIYMNTDDTVSDESQLRLHNIVRIQIADARRLIDDFNINTTDWLNRGIHLEYIQGINNNDVTLPILSREGGALSITADDNTDYTDSELENIVDQILEMDQQICSLLESIHNTLIALSSAIQRIEGFSELPDYESALRGLNNAWLEVVRTYPYFAYSDDIDIMNGASFVYNLELRTSDNDPESSKSASKRKKDDDPESSKSASKRKKK